MSDEETQHAIQMFREVRAENELLRAIVADLTECSIGDYETGDCVLCHGVYEHDPTCPYQRAHEAVARPQYGPRPACPECGKVVSL